MKDLVCRELPETARQLRDTQDLLRSAAEEIMTLLETWDQRLENPAGSEPDEETRDLRAFITSLFEKMSFQDLAGQRLAKVETFLKALGETVRPAAASGRSQPRRFRSKAAENPETGPSAKPALKGPQAAGGGLDQREIEALLADLQGREG
jgi:hypothetical protein